MKCLTALLLLVASTATAVDSLPKLSIFRGSKRPILVNLDSVERLKTILSKTPHRQLNPEGKVSEFQGLDLIELLHLTQADRSLLVHFIGVDGYVSVVPASVLLKTNAILAFKQDGRALADREGGVQVIFPTEGNRAVEERYAKKAAFWCWYVRSIVVGDLPNAMKSPEWRLAKILQAAKPVHFEAPSVFQFEKTQCPNTVRIPLSKLKPQGAATVTLLSGALKNVDPGKFELVLSASSAALPVRCGGPFALVEQSKLVANQGVLLGKELELGVTQIQ